MSETTLRLLYSFARNNIKLSLFMQMGENDHAHYQFVMADHIELVV